MVFRHFSIVFDAYAWGAAFGFNLLETKWVRHQLTRIGGVVPAL